jgi:hypothetical protein
LVFNLLAPQPGNNTYLAYHAFPQFLMYVIPLVVASGTMKFAGPRDDAEKQPAKSQAQKIHLYYSAMVIASASAAFVPRWVITQIRDAAWVGTDGLSVVSSTDRFFQLFKTAKPALGVMVADDPVMALAPRLFLMSERVAFMPSSRWAEMTKAALEPAAADGHDSIRPDSFLFFENSRAFNRLGGMLGADYRVFDIAGTRMFLATTKSLPINGLATMLEPTNRASAMMHTNDLARKSATGIRIQSHLHSQSRRGLAIYGPYVRLPAGRYRVRFFFASAGGGAAIPTGCNVDVFASGKTFAQSRCVKADDAKTLRNLAVPLDFRVEEQDSARLFEFRVWLNGDGEMELTDVVLEFCGSVSCNDNENVTRP